MVDLYPLESQRVRYLRGWGERTTTSSLLLPDLQSVGPELERDEPVTDQHTRTHSVRETPKESSRGVPVEVLARKVDSPRPT